MKLRKEIKNGFKVIFSALVILVMLLSPLSVYAQNTLEDLQKQRDLLTKKLEEITKNKSSADKTLKDLKSQKSSVENDIKILNLEINQQQLVIDEKETEIEKKQNEIEILENQIVILKQTLSVLDLDINQKKQVADKRLQNMYKAMISNSTLNLIFNTSNTQDFLAKIKYQRLLRGKDEDVLKTLKVDRDNYDTQKKDFETKKNEVQTLADSITLEKSELEKAKNSLEIQKSQKQSKLNSLSSTVNFQQNYYNSLTNEQKSVENQIMQVQTELFNQYKQVSSGIFIKKGTWIGTMGCTGYCTGAHLHYFLSKNSSTSTNPCPYLPAGKFSFCGGGTEPKLDWPMKGNLIWSRGFGGSHYAIDIIGTNDKSLYASHDGWIKYGVESCETYKYNATAYGYCKKNGPARYAIICETKEDCTKGLKTGYWHLSN